MPGPLGSVETGLGNVPTAGANGGGGGGRAAGWIGFGQFSPASDSTELNSSITRLFNSGGGTIELPHGVHDFQATINCQQGVSLVGPGAASCTLRRSGALVTAGDFLSLLNCRGVHLEGFTLGATSPTVAGRAIYVKGGDSTIPLNGFALSLNETFVDVDMEDQHDGAVVENDATKSNWIVHIGSDRAGSWRNFTGGDALRIDCNSGTFYGASHFIRRLFIWNDDNTVNGDAMKMVGSGDWNIADCETFGFKHGLHICPPSGGRMTTGRVHNNYFDTSNDHAVLIEPHSLAVFGDIDFNGVWFGGAGVVSGAAVHGCLMNNPAGDVGGWPHGANVRYRGCQFVANRNYGLVMTGTGTGCKGVQVGDTQFTANTLAGFRAVLATDFSIVNCLADQDFLGLGLSQVSGGQVDLGCSQFIVSLNNFRDSTGTPFVDNSGAVTKVVANNL